MFFRLTSSWLILTERKESLITSVMKTKAQFDEQVINQLRILNVNWQFPDVFRNQTMNLFNMVILTEIRSKDGSENSSIHADCLRNFVNETWYELGSKFLQTLQAMMIEILKESSAGYIRQQFNAYILMKTQSQLSILGICSDI